jgi:basic amino acid/polyamine antiporter, APA family
MQQKAKLGLFDFTMIVVSLVIGMGIFRTPVNVAQNSPTVFLFFASWITGGIIALCGALTYAEIGSRLPVTGAYYKVFAYGYHPSVAFAVNCIILISNAASLSAVALVGAEYISTVLFPGDVHVQNAEIIIAIGSILLFYGVNLLGLKMSARAQNVLTVIKISMILLLITPLFFVPDSVAAQVSHPPASMSWIEYLKGFGKGLVAVSFTCGGYQQTINFGAEVDKGSRNIPKGIFMGIAIIIILYLTINYAYIKVIGLDQLRNSKGIAAVMASHIFGAAAGKIVSILLFFSVLAYVNVLLMSNPRVMFAMSADGVLPPLCGLRSKKNQVLVASLSIFAALSMLIVFWAKQFDEILSFTIFLDCIGMAASAATIFVLRKKKVKPADTTIYTVKLYPWLPLIFITAYLFIAISIFSDKPYTALAGLAVLFSFMIIYFVTRHRKNPPAAR